MRDVIAVTGSSGFIGNALAHELASRSFRVRGVCRDPNSSLVSIDDKSDSVVVADIDSLTDWSEALREVSCVIHCAARAHIRDESTTDAFRAYKAVNVDGSRRLAEQAAASGVRRLVHLSSIKVNGEQTAPEAPFLFSDPPAPEDLYGLSKLEAEQALWDVSSKTGLEVVVIRPPLVYGHGVKGNLARLIKLLRTGLPLPLAAVQNKRSMIGLDNLVDLLIRAVDHPAAAGQTFLVSDGEDLSTPDFLHQMASAMHRSVKLVPVPVPLLRLAGNALGRLAEVDRLVRSLQVDSTHMRDVLGWTPVVSIQDGIRRMVQQA